MGSIAPKAQKKQARLTTDPDDQAFATPMVAAAEGGCIADDRIPGLTKREYFAALALSGLLADPEMTSMRDSARLAVKAADLLIEALNTGDL